MLDQYFSALKDQMLEFTVLPGADTERERERGKRGHAGDTEGETKRPINQLF